MYTFQFFSISVKISSLIGRFANTSGAGLAGLLSGEIYHLTGFSTVSIKHCTFLYEEEENT